MAGENNRVPESIVVKLFDQTKDASNQNAERIKDLTRAVDDLTRFLEKQPDLQPDVKEIKGDVKSLSGKVKTMILVVLIAFALMSVSYIYVRGSIKTMVKDTVAEHVIGNDVNDTD